MYSISQLYNNIKIATSAIVAIIIAFLMPIIPLIIVVGMFIAADTIIGIWRSIKTSQTITSKRLSNIISKMVLYQSAVVLFFIMEKYILVDFVGYFVKIPWFITKIIACTLCSIELKSIDESVQEVMGFSIWDKFKLLLKRSNEVKKGVQNIINNENNE